MKMLVCLLEELSAKNMLDAILPKLLPADSNIEYKLIAFNGKSDLEKHIVNKDMLLEKAKYILFDYAGSGFWRLQSNKKASPEFGGSDWEKKVLFDSYCLS